MTWVAGIIAIVILALAGFLVFQLLSGGEPPSGRSRSRTSSACRSPTPRRWPKTGASRSSRTRPTSSDPTQVGQVLAQDPQPGTEIDPDTPVKLTVAVGVGTVGVPDLRNKSEQEAFQLLFTAGLAPGTETEMFDPAVPVGHRDPGALARRHRQPGHGRRVRGLEGTEPSPTPTPTPTPTPDPDPDAHPTPPPPTAPPTPRRSRSATTAA